MIIKKQPGIISCVVFFALTSMGLTTNAASESLQEKAKKVVFDRDKLAKEFHVEGEPKTWGVVPFKGGKYAISPLVGLWRVQWNPSRVLGEQRMLPGIPYRIFVEVKARKRFMEKAQSLIIGFHVYNRKQKEPLFKKTVTAKALRVNEFVTINAGVIAAADYNGYFYLTYFPKKLKFTRENALLVRRIYAEIAFDRIDPEKLAVIISRYRTKKEAAKKILEKWHRNLPSFPQGKLFLTGSFFGPGGLPYAARYVDIPLEILLDNVMRSMKMNQQDTFVMNELSADPKHVLLLLKIAAKYKMRVLAGTMGKPLSDRYASRQKIEKMNWNATIGKIKKLTAAVKNNPAFLGYYLCDESKPFQQVPMIKAMQLFYRFDPKHVAVPLTWRMTKYMPIVNTRPGYAFYKQKLDQYNALAEIRNYADEIRAETRRPIWFILHAFKSQNGSSIMPKPHEMEAQTYLAFSGKVTGLFYFYYFLGHSWLYNMEGVVDSFMTINSTGKHLAKVLGDIRGVGDLVASQGKYLENDQDGIKVKTAPFKQFFAGSRKREEHPQIRYGTYELNNNRGKIVVAVNQDIKHPANMNLTAPGKLYDLISLKTINPQKTSFSFKPGQGRIFYCGNDFSYVKNQVEAARKQYQRDILDIKIKTARQNGVKILPHASRHEYDKAISTNQDFQAKLKILNKLQADLSACARGVPYKKRHWSDKSPFIQIHQEINKATGLYLSARYKFNNSAEISLDNLRETDVKIRKHIASIKANPHFSKHNENIHRETIKSVQMDEAFN